MKRSVFAVALVLVLGAAFVAVRAQDEGDKKDKKRFHVTVWMQGVNDPIELDEVTVWHHNEKGFTTHSASGGESWFASDKVVAWVAEPPAVHKKQQEDKAPK